MMAVRRKIIVALVVLPATLLWLAAATRVADVPELAGDWTWSWKDQNGETHRHLLEVEGRRSRGSAPSSPRASGSTTSRPSRVTEPVRMGDSPDFSPYSCGD
jgi:hypothetical protein